MMAMPWLPKLERGFKSLESDGVMRDGPFDPTDRMRPVGPAKSAEAGQCPMPRQSGNISPVPNREEISAKPCHRLALRVVRNRMEIGPDHLIQPYAVAQTWSVLGAKIPAA